MCIVSFLKLTIFVGPHDIPVFIIKDSSMILILVGNHIYTCQFLTQNLLLTTFIRTVIMLVHFLELSLVSVVIPSIMHDFRLLPRCKSDFPSSGMLRCVDI